MFYTLLSFQFSHWHVNGWERAQSLLYIVGNWRGWVAIETSSSEAYHLIHLWCEDIRTPPGGGQEGVMCLEVCSQIRRVPLTSDELLRGLRPGWNWISPPLGARTLRWNNTTIYGGIRHCTCCICYKEKPHSQLYTLLMKRSAISHVNIYSCL